MSARRLLRLRMQRSPPPQETTPPHGHAWEEAEESEGGSGGPADRPRRLSDPSSPAKGQPSASDGAGGSHGLSPSGSLQTTRTEGSALRAQLAAARYGLTLPTPVADRPSSSPASSPAPRPPVPFRVHSPRHAPPLGPSAAMAYLRRLQAEDTAHREASWNSMVNVARGDPDIQNHWDRRLGNFAPPAPPAGTRAVSQPSCLRAQPAHPCEASSFAAALAAAVGNPHGSRGHRQPPSQYDINGRRVQPSRSRPPSASPRPLNHRTTSASPQSTRSHVDHRPPCTLRY